MSNKMLYKVIFINEDTVYEIFAKEICESDILGFLEVEEIVFGESDSIVVTPTEDRLKREFKGVKRSYIPMHSIVRIDEVDKKGTAKISDFKKSDKKINKIYQLPVRPVE